MKKTYVTTMPNHIGAFLKASSLLSKHNVNITRVSYNKAIDSHTLFIDAEGCEQDLIKAEEELIKIGYLKNSNIDHNIVLLEFKLLDKPGSVTNILEVINEFNFNISYISSQENGTDYQYFKMGLFVDDAEKITRFLQKVEKLCSVRVIDYNHAEKVYDNSIFYKSFVNTLAGYFELNQEDKDQLLVNANLAMQTLDEKGLSPYKTFDSINRFAELLEKSKGDNFTPRITTHNLTEDTTIILIEPPCGSNTIIIKSNNELLFIDSGYACYKNEMLKIFKEIFKDFDKVNKSLLITHADVDHCGLLDMFDNVFVSQRTADCLEKEYRGVDGFRESNALHKPYINICKILTAYKPVNPKKLRVICSAADFSNDVLKEVGVFSFGELEFLVYEGAGGHLPGEIILIENNYKIAFTGDVYINLKGLTSRQAEYNKYAPILMTSVDTNSVLSNKERIEFLKLIGGRGFTVFGSHGFKKELG